MSMAAYGAPMYMVIICPVSLMITFIYFLINLNIFYNCIYIFYIIIISAGYLNLYGQSMSSGSMPNWIGRNYHIASWTTHQFQNYYCNCSLFQFSSPMGDMTAAVPVINASSRQPACGLQPPRWKPFSLQMGCPIF